MSDSRSSPARCNDGNSSGAAPTNRTSKPQGSGSASARRANARPHLKTPYSGARPKLKTIYPHVSTDTQTPGALSTFMLPNRTALDQTGNIVFPIAAHVGPACKPVEATSRPGLYPSLSFQPLAATSCPVRTPTPPCPTSIRAPPAGMTRTPHPSTAAPVSLFRTHVGIPIGQPVMNAVPKERSLGGKTGGSADGAKTTNQMVGLLPIGSLPVQLYIPGSEVASTVDHTRCMMGNSSTRASFAALSHGSIGATTAPAELCQHDQRNMLTPTTSSFSPRQAAVFSIQTVPLTDGSGRCAAICVPASAVVPVFLSHVFTPIATAPLNGHMCAQSYSDPEL